MHAKLDPFLDACAQAQLVRRGEVAPVDLVDQAIERIQQLNPALNAVIHERFEQARAEAKHAAGPFRGVPYLLKDLTYSKGDLHCAGIAGVKAARYRADHDSHVVTGLRKAGFVIVGSTNTPELGLTATTEPVAFGPTRNPWNLEHSTGGSSGGSSAAVAAALVPVAHGSDGGGSVRMPSSQCGIVGLKPTRGRISTGPLVRDTDNVSGMSHEGLHTRTVRDLAAMLDVLDGARPGDAYRAPPPLRPFAQEVGADPGRLRIGVLTSDPSGQISVHPQCVFAARAAATALSRLGHQVEDGFPAVLRNGSWPQEFMPCIAVVVLRELEYYGRLIGRALTEEDVEFSTWNYAQMGRQVTVAQYTAGIDSIRVQTREMENWWEEGWDLLLTPTMPVLPPRIGEIQPTRENPFSTLAMSLSHYTVPFNVSGQPAISLPLHWTDDGLPVGVQLAAAYGRDDLLIRVAAQLEQVMPWAGRRPPMAAKGVQS
jgi:Asp-tRNA(Asn)/Glu-tRNA(Gln) amidotransferase A subunit family amidase